jgi:hypothetical protein
MEKGKRKGVSLLARPGGGFRPDRGARAGRRPSRPMEGRNGAGERRGRGPTRQREEGGGVTTSGGKAVRDGENRSPVKFRRGSSPVVRFCVDRMVVRHVQR